MWGSVIRVPVILKLDTYWNKLSDSCCSRLSRAPISHWTGRWVGSTDSLDDLEYRIISFPCQESDVIKSQWLFSAEYMEIHDRAWWFRKDLGESSLVCCKISPGIHSEGLMRSWNTSARIDDILADIPEWKLTNSESKRYPWNRLACFLGSTST